MSNARLEELRSKFQDNPRRYFAPFANELRKSGDSAQAIEICRTHLSSQPGHVSGHIVLAQALHEAAELAEARQVFTTALELDPENLIALRSMGEIAYANGEFGDARRWYERLLDADPRNADVAQLIADLVDQPVVDFAAETAAATQPPPVPSGPPPLSFAGPDGPDRSDDRAIEAEGAVEDVIGFEPAPQASASTRPEPQAVPDEPLDLDVLATGEDAIGDLAASPEPMALEDVDDAREPVSRAGSLEIEDMESFLSPPSSPVVDPVSEAGTALEAELEFSTEPFAEDKATIRDETDRDESDHWARGTTDELEVGPSEADSSAPETGFGTPASDWSDAAVLESDAAAAPTISSDPADSEPEAAPEPPHALFAENGFEGSAASTDASGWKTPQAYPEESDPASSAEWIDHAPAGDAPAVDASAPADADSDDWFATESSASAAAEPTDARDDDWFVSEIAAQATPSHDDDWFDAPPPEPELPVSSRAGGADLYLAPELVPVTNGGDAAAVDDEVVQADAVAAAGEPVESIAAPEVSLEPGARFPVDAEVTAEVPDASSAPDETPPEAMVPPVPPATAVALPHATLGHTPRFSAAMAPETPSTPPFVTETLAELYIKQGFHNEALAIYRQLAERDPGDDAIRRRIEALEVGETASVSRQADEPDELTEEHRVKSQSVRGYFAGFARRTPSAAAVEARLSRNAGEAGGEEGMARPDATADPSGGQPESSFAAAASALATLFAASRPGGADEGAASKLAGAYTEPAPGGRPSRAADRELSLDHLFRDVPASGTGGVMLDQFYSSPVDSSGQAARPDEGAGTPDEGEADIRQFTAWLEGLRKK